jgi:hypothetical protein
MFQIYKNFCDENTLFNLQSLAYFKNFWQLTEPMTRYDMFQDSILGNFQFCHEFYNKKNNYESEFFHEVKPLLNNIENKLELNNFFRVKMNIITYMKESYIDLYHVDTKKDHLVCLFYVNSNNGQTEFDDGHIITSNENTLVVFDGKKQHRVRTQTNSNYRMVVNINYYI